MRACVLACDTHAKHTNRPVTMVQGGQGVTIQLLELLQECAQQRVLGLLHLRVSRHTARLRRVEQAWRAGGARVAAQNAERRR